MKYFYLIFSSLKRKKLRTGLTILSIMVAFILFGYLTAIRQDLHAHPELGFEETRTAGIVAEQLRAYGVDEVHEGLGGTGVVAVIRGQGGGNRRIGLRADMDALPITEESGLPFASRHPGVMHACGHDTHMAGFIGAAQLLAERKDEWQGTLVMILQPAEELGLGALAMLEDGLYERFPKPDYTIAFHDAAAPAPAGTIGYTPGYALANVDSVDISEDMTEMAEKNLQALNIDNVKLSTGDASKGWAQKRNYDVIAITAAMKSIPDSYKKLLKPGGRLFVVIGDAPAMTAQLVTRTGENSWTVEDLFETSIEPMIQPVKQTFEF